MEHMVNVLLSECAWGRLEAGPQWVPVGRLATDRCLPLAPAESAQLSLTTHAFRGLSMSNHRHPAMVACTLIGKISIPCLELTAVHTPGSFTSLPTVALRLLVEPSNRLAAAGLCCC